jgi:hypothetical protein
MPDQYGRLTPDDHEKIRDWWTAPGHWHGPVECTVCKTAAWSTMDHVVVVQRHSLFNNVPGTVAYPMIGVVCNQCSHTMFFSAVRMGIAEVYDPSNDPITLAALPPPSGSGG